MIPPWFLCVETQPEVEEAGYDAGAAILQGFFKRELPKFLHPDLDPLGKKIITCCLDQGTVQDYGALLHGNTFIRS